MGWVTAWSTAALTTKNTGQANYLNRQYWPAALISASGDKVRITLQSRDDKDYKIAEMYIGHRDTGKEEWDFDGNQVRVTWDTGNNGCTVLQGVDKLSDEITIDIDEAKELLISYYGDDVTWDDWNHGTVATSNLYYKSGATADVATSDVASLSTAANLCMIINKIEVSATDTSKAVPALASPDTFVAPTLGNVFVPAISTPDSFLAPYVNPAFPPALASPDTFVAPVFNRSINIGVLSSPDTFVAPTIVFGVLVPSISLVDVFLAPRIIGGTTHRDKKLLNLTGQHVSMKFQNSVLGEGLRLNTVGFRAFKLPIRNLNKVNMTAHHASLKFQNTTPGEEFALKDIGVRIDFLPER